MGTYQSPGRPNSGRQFGQAGSLRPDTMTGFDRRDKVTGMQNDQNRERSLYNRIFRQQSRASRKGDIEAGQGALKTMSDARAAGYFVGGIQSSNANNDVASESLDIIEEQTAMMERNAAPVSGAQGIPEVPGMQQPPAASLADSFQEEMDSVGGVNKISSQADNRGSQFAELTGRQQDNDGSVFAGLTGTDPNAGTIPDPDFTHTDGGVTTLRDASGNVIGSSRPAAATPSLSDDFAKKFPLTAKLIAGSQSNPSRGSTPNNYNPATDPELSQFKENEAKFGREEAMRRATAEAKDPVRTKNMQEDFDRDQKRKKSLVDMAESRKVDTRPPVTEDALFSSDSDYLSNPEDIRWRDFQRSEKEKEAAWLQAKRDAEEMSAFNRKLDRNAKKRNLLTSR